jgi:glycosyltransferase involved in cell wall biosynthesis
VRYSSRRVGEAFVRVTMISKACVVGAYQTKLEALAAQPGIELTVVVPPYWREGAHRLALERAHTQGFEMAVAPLAFNGSFHTHFYPTLGGILRRARPEIVHMDEEPYNLATYLAVRQARAVGAQALFFTWQNLERRYPWPFGAIERAVYRGVSAAIAGNQEAVSVLRAKGYAGPVEVIPQFGVDPTRFHPAEGPRPVRPLTIGYAGRLVEAKGLLVLAEALEGLSGDWRLEMLGAGTLREELQRRFSMTGLSDRVRVHAHVPSGEMPARLAQLDVLVLPSLTRPNWKEQFGRVLVEAMACGVAVIGSDSGEIPNVIGEAGVIVPEGQAQALRAQLAALIAKPERCVALGSLGRERVLARFTQAQIAARTAELYRRLLDPPAHTI